jgi:hypothetical protein
MSTLPVNNSDNKVVTMMSLKNFKSNTLPKGVLLFLEASAGLISVYSGF